MIIDCPGQAELYIVGKSIKDIIEHLTMLDFRLAAVHLVDFHNSLDPGVLAGHFR